jgi:hypothetical protein
MYRAAILGLLVSACAADNTPDPPVVPAPMMESQRDPPPEKDTKEEPSGITCTIVQSVSGGGCVLNVIECSDGTQRLDGKCYPGYTLPWKNLPDPPPDKDR